MEVVALALGSVISAIGILEIRRGSITHMIDDPQWMRFARGGLLVLGGLAMVGGGIARMT
jgi:hypothetical protein